MENGVEFGRESKFGKIDKYKGLFTLMPKKTLPKFGIAKFWYSCQNFGNLPKFWQDFLYSYQNLAAN
jgi:hypothetical protein